MALLRIFPVWQLVPRYTELEVEPGAVLRDTLGEALGIFAERLKAVDRTGTEQTLDITAPDAAALPDFALSLQPILHPMGLFDEPFVAQSSVPSGSGLTDFSGKGPDFWPLMTEPERNLGTGLLALGFGLDLSTLDLERLAASFPELEGGWGTTQSSPYRFLMAAAAVLAEREKESLERLEVQAEQAACLLWPRLRLTQPDALDMRLHIFHELTPGGMELLREYLDQHHKADIPGRVRGGWRRVVVHPYRDDVDRLRQMANLGRRMSVERQDARLRRALQSACSDFVLRYTEKAWLDHQAQVTIRPFEEKLLVQGRQLLLERLGRRLSELEGASSGLSSDLAHGVFRRCGFFEGQFETDGPRIAEVAWQLTSSIFRRCDQELGGPIESLDPSLDEPLRGWIRSLEGSGPLALLPQADLEKVGKTVALDLACRLRFQIETLLEAKTFPPYGEAEISFAQFLEIVSLLHEELDRLRDSQDGESRLATWLSEQEAELGAEVQRRRAEVIGVADFMFNLPGRFLARFGVGDRDRYRRLAEAVDGLRRCWLGWRCFQMLLTGLREGDLGDAFDFAADLASRFEAMAREVAAIQEEMAQEIGQREKLAALGAMVLDAPLSPELEDRLWRSIDQLPLDPAFRQVFRRDGQLRNLVRLRPDRVMQELMDSLEESLLTAVRQIAADAPVPQVSDLLTAAVDQLFVDSPVQHSGRAGRVGAFDHQTHLVLMLSPELARQFAEGRDLVARIRRRLGEIGVSEELPIAALSSPDVPGVILIRCVHALGVEDLVA